MSLIDSCYLVVVLLLVVRTSLVESRITPKNIGSFCVNDTSRGDPNMLPIESGPPRLIRTIKNGALYQVGVGEDQSWLAHVWGETGYDYGYAYGTLLSEQINKFMPMVYRHLEQEIIDNLDNIKLPKWLKEVVVDKGLGVALDLQDALAEPYMEKEIYQEIHGMADATKMDYKLLRRLHMFGELTRGKRPNEASTYLHLMCL
jgi:hypothetical protein